MIKESLNHKINYAKSFYINHKAEIVLGVITITSVSYALITKNKSKKLVLENNNLSKQYIEVCKTNDILYSRNMFLEQLCIEKDSYFKKAISEDFRHGGSFGAQQMAFKRWDAPLA